MNARPRLLVLSHHYRPEPNFITADVAEALAQHFDVTVVAPHPYYPFDHFYPGVRWWRIAKTIENGVTVWRVPMYPYHGRSHAKRALSYLSSAFMAAVVAPFAAGRAQTVWVYHGPFTVGLAALWFKWVMRARVIFTCADLWPESFLAAGVAGPGLVMRLMFRYSRAINRIANDLICSTRGTLARYAADRIPRERLHFVPVWVDGIGEAPAGPAEPTGAPRVVYAGNLGPAQCLDTVVRAAAELEQRGIAVTFELYGTGNAEPDLRRLAEQLQVRSVRFMGRVEPARAFEASSTAFAQIVSLQPSPLFRMTVPSKLSFCCAAGAPLLYGLQGEAADMASETGGGVPYDPTDHVSLTSAVEQLLARSADERAVMRRNLRRYYEQNLARPMLLERYADIFLQRAARPGEVEHSVSFARS